MLRTLSFLLPVLLVGLLSSCSVPIYDVDKLHTPLYTRKGDISLEGGYGITGFSGTASYAFTDYLALSGHANYFYRHSSDSNLHNQTLFEVIGTYYSAPKGSLAGYVSAGFAKCDFEFVGGVGNFIYSDTYYRTSGSYNKYSIQGSLTTKVFDIAATGLESMPPQHQLGIKLSFIDFQSYKYYSGYDPASLSSGTIEDNRVYVEVGSSHIFPISAVRNLYLTAQWGLVAPIDDKTYGDANPFIGSIGIQYLMNFTKRAP